jgi:phosphatidate cytidylyltransferase
MYVSWGFFHLILLRDLQNGFWLVIYAFLIVWSTDTGAYFIGSCLGKHKFAPLISPKKSWEGFAGGIVSSLIIAYIYWLCLPSIGGRTLLYISVLVSVAGQLGDLFESSFKRFAQIKDSGNLIPGHGGILDRFDSILWAAPVTYYLYTLIERMF